LILELYISLALLSLAAIVVGHYTQVPHYALVGFSFLFVLGGIMLTGNLTYNSGYNYTTGGDGNIAAATPIQTPWIDSYSHIIGIFLAVASALAAILIITNIRTEATEASL
jgi:hypothetical protein